MSESSFEERWRKILEILEAAGLGQLAAYVRDESSAAHAAPLSIPVIGEMGSGKSALVARIFGVDRLATFPQDVLESTARPVEVKYASANYRALVHGDTEEWEECSEDDARWDALVRGREPIRAGSRLEVGLGSEQLATWNASLVDTPGMNTNTPELEGRAWAAAATAPVVILAIPATSTGRKTDVDYLESLGDNSASVVIALTKADQLPLDSVDRVVADFRHRLAERGVSPLAILPTSSTAETGIAAIRQVLSEVTGTRREQLIAHHLGGRVTEKLGRELSALRLKQSALKADALTIRDQGKGVERDIVEEGADQEAGIRDAASTLKDRCRRLRFEAFNHMREIGQETLQAISEKIATLQIRDEVQRFANSSVRSYVLQWREACVAAAEDRLRQLDQAGVEIAQTVASQHLEQKGVSTDWLQELPQGGVASHSDEDLPHIEDVHHSREELLRQIEALRKHAPAEELEGIQQALAATQAERDKLTYVPQMDRVSLDQGKEEFQQAGRMLGGIADMVLTLAPIPIGGKFGKFLKTLPRGAQIIRGIENHNRRIIDRNNRLRDRKGPTHIKDGMEQFGENFSLETWGGRLGGAIGGYFHPDKVVEIENEEVRQEFLKLKKPLDDEMHRLGYEREKIRLRQGHYEQLLREKRTELERVEEQTLRLERERKALEEDRRNLQRDEEASKAKLALMAQLSRQFLSRDGDSLFADIRRAVSAGFDSAHEALENHLRERVNAIKAEVQAALQEAQAKQTQGEAAVKEALESNQKMCSALQSAMSSLEAL